MPIEQQLDCLWCLFWQLDMALSCEYNIIVSTHEATVLLFNWATICQKMHLVVS